MNYIELFLNDHDLVVGQPFKISISPKLWFYFCDDFHIDLVGEDEIMRSWTNFDSIFLRLLTGEIQITKILGK